jgi:photosystem II stability/assembly factor-like uncharacterized protein
MYFLLILLSLNFSNKSLDSITDIKNITVYPQEGQSIRALTVVSDSEIHFASDQGVYGKTLDSGENWDIQNVYFKENPIAFRSIAKTETNFFLLSIGTPALLYKISQNTKELVYQEYGETVFYDAISFDKNGIGVAIGDSDQHGMRILRTEDYGNTWQRVADKYTPKSIIGEGAFAASNSNLKQIDELTYFISGGVVSRFYTSRDKGKSWTCSELPLINNKATTGAYTMDFYNKDIGIVAGGDYKDKSASFKTMAITKDGGLTWELISESNSPGYKSCIQYAPNSQGNTIIAVSINGLSISNDGGQNWKTNSDIKGYYTIRFLDSKTAWMAGANKVAKVNFH